MKSHLLLAVIGMLALLLNANASGSPADTVSVFPYYDDFEAVSTDWTTGTIAGGPNDWVLGTPAKVQIAGAHSGLKAFVTKLTGNYSNGQESYLRSPTFNMTSLSGVVVLEFWQNFKTEYQWDGGVLELSRDGGTSWQRVDSVAGTGPTYDTELSAGWYNTDVGNGNITAPFWSNGSTTYAGQAAGWIRTRTAITGIAGLPAVCFRWHFSSDLSTSFEGWAIDDVSISALPPHDIGLTGLSIPGYVGGPAPGDVISLKSGGSGSTFGSKKVPRPAGVPAGLPVTVDAATRNFGASVETAYQVGWTLDAVPQTAVDNILPLQIEGHDTLPLTINAPVAGIHNIRAWTVLGTDPFPANDSASFAFEVLDTNVVFYEGFNGALFPPAGWSNINADGNVGPVTKWYAGAFAPPEEGAGVAGDDYRTANGFLVDDYLITPNVGNPSEALTVDSLSFWLVANGAFPDSIQIRVSTSTAGIDSFTILLDYIRPSTEWTKYTYVLPPGANRYVAFRYLLYNGGPGGANSDAVALDNVRITRYRFLGLLSAPAEAAFDSVAVGQTKVDTITVTNSGNLGLTITGVNVTGSPDFTASPPGPVSLEPLATAKFFASFTPSAMGPASANLVFTHTGDNSPTTVMLQGVGTQAHFAVTPLAVTFDTVPVGFTSMHSVLMRNTGNIPVNVTGIASTDPVDFAVAPSSVIIAAGDSSPAYITFQPASPGPKNARVLFTHNGPTSPDTVTVSGTGGVPMVFTSLPPDSVIKEDPLKPGRPSKPAKRFKGLYPNWSNLLSEIVTQGGFQPGTSESDSAGGARVGISFMYLKDPVRYRWAPRRDSIVLYHWVRLSKWDQVKRIGKNFDKLQKTLIDRSGRHTGAPTGLDSTLYVGAPKRRLLKGQYTTLPPKKQSNRLFAEMVALKVNIAASALGRTPPGFGDLIFNRPGHPYNGMSVIHISAMIDTILTHWQGRPYSEFDSAYTALFMINRAFVGRLDTVQWEQGGKLLAKLVVAGKVNLASVPYLLMPPGAFEPTRITATTNLTEAPDDFEDTDYDDTESMAVAATLHQNYPNPFNPATTIAFTLKEYSKVTVRVYDILGREVTTLADGEEMDEGYQTLDFDAANLASGIYFYRIDAQGLDEAGLHTSATQKMLLIK